MTYRSTYLTASTVLALALAAPIMVAAQPDQNGGGQDHSDRRPDQGGGHGSRQPTVRAPGQQQQQRREPNQSAAPIRGGAPIAERSRPASPSSTGGPSHQNGQARMPDHGVQRHSDQPAPARKQRNLAPQRRAESTETPPRQTARPENVQRLRRNVQGQHHYRAGAYQTPRGYAQRRWSYGERLPSSYYSRNYWIGNYLLYSLFAPPSGLVWVRVGNDAFLVDRYDGEIIQARYNVFY